MKKNDWKRFCDEKYDSLLNKVIERFRGKKEDIFSNIPNLKNTKIKPESVSAQISFIPLSAIRTKYFTKEIAILTKFLELQDIRPILMSLSVSIDMADYPELHEIIDHLHSDPSKDWIVLLGGIDIFEVPKDIKLPIVKELDDESVIPICDFLLGNDPDKLAIYVKAKDDNETFSVKTKLFIWVDNEDRRVSIDFHFGFTNMEIMETIGLSRVVKSDIENAYDTLFNGENQLKLNNTTVDDIKKEMETAIIKDMFKEVEGPKVSISYNNKKEISDNSATE